MFREARATIVGKAMWKPLNLTPPTGKILSSIIISQEELPKYLKDKGLRITIISPFTFHAGPHAKQIYTLKDNNRLLPIRPVSRPMCSFWSWRAMFSREDRWAWDKLPLIWRNHFFPPYISSSSHSYGNDYHIHFSLSSRLGLLSCTVIMPSEINYNI